MPQNIRNASHITPLGLEEAVQKLRAGAVRIRDAFELPVRNAYGYVLAEDIFALHDQPPFPRSPFDGYAVRSEDTTGATGDCPVCLTVVGEVDAGEWPKEAVGKGEAVRIMTGAPIPEGADAVIKQEETDYGEDVVRIFKEMRRDQNYIFPGEDYKKGALLLKSGDRLGAAELGILASNGLTRVRVYRKPKAAVISTGDELAEPGAPLAAGKIYDSNGLTACVQLEEWGCEVCETLQVPDDPEICAGHIRRLADRVDFIVTSGGVSVGKKDIMHDVFAMLDVQTVFWKVGIKPGAAMLAGKYGDTLILSLSGNPYAACINLHMIVRQVLSAMTGNSDLEMIRQRAVLDDAYDRPSPVRRFVRCFVQDGHVSLADHIGGNGDVAASRHINAVIDIPAGSGALPAGTEVTVMLLS